jgi:uncharacterized protein YdaU (DUF1376 family)
VNFYHHHIGDYDSATAHLSALEDGVYCRLIRRYYTTESPLPADRAKLARLVRLRTNEELAALDVVLDEFFVLDGDVYRQTRCDEEISVFREGAEDRKLRKENEKERQRRSRERRHQMFEILRSHGVVLPWDTSMSQLETHLSRVTGGVTGPLQDATGGVTGGVTARVQNAPDTATHTHTQTQTQTQILEGAAVAPPDEKPARPDSRGTRLEPNFELPAAWLDWCRETWPDVSTSHWRKVADTFRDYWLGRPGAEGRKSDWLATWRNWCRREMERKGNAAGAPQRSSARPDWMKGAI